MSKKSNTFLAFLTGVATGTVVGMLYAPDKGENTRGKLTYQLDKYQKKLKEIVQELARGRQMINNKAKEEGQRVVDNAKQQAEDLLEDVNGLISHIKSGDEKDGA